jgi:phage-related protein
MCNWKVISYETNSGRNPVIEYIQLQEVERANNISNAIRLLEEFGIGESLLNARKLKGKSYKGLYELIVGSSRIIYFLHTDKEFVLLHGFTKKSNKTPKVELEKAKRRMKDFLR